MSLKAEIADKIVINTRENLRESEEQREQQSSRVALRAFLIPANLGFSFVRHEMTKGKEVKSLVLLQVGRLIGNPSIEAGPKGTQHQSKRNENYA